MLGHSKEGDAINLICKMHGEGRISGSSGALDYADFEKCIYEGPDIIDYLNSQYGILEELSLASNVEEFEWDYFFGDPYDVELTHELKFHFKPIDEKNLPPHSSYLVLTNLYDIYYVDNNDDCYGTSWGEKIKVIDGVNFGRYVGKKDWLENDDYYIFKIVH